MQISATAAQVGTVRLVVAAVARRSGVADDSLDEIRLAVGEACSRAVNLHRAYAPAEPVTVLIDGDGRFVVSVCDRAPAGTGDGRGPDLPSLDSLGRDVDPDEPLPAGFGLAVIDGLVDDVDIGPGSDGTGTVVRMSWPLAASSHARSRG